MVGGSVAMATASGLGWRIVARFGRAAVVCALMLECGVVAGYIVAVEVIAQPTVFVVVALLSVVSGTASGFVDAPNRAMTLAYAPNGANGVAAGFLQLVQRLSATVALTGVSGLYLAASGSGIGGSGHAISAALSVCLSMVLLSLVCAVADLRRRATESESR
jgi:hypothetical protein